MKLVLSAITIALILLVFDAQSQKAPLKFGDVSPEALKMTSYPLDTSAAAVVLADFGESNFRYDQEKGFVLVFDRIRRYKILKPEGVNLINFKIATYHRGTNEEKLSNLKAISYNLEGGKVVESKMKSESIFKEAYDKNFNLTSFTVPNVKVGSVVDLTYTITSDFFSNLQDWEFQSTIPTAWSEYRVKVPEYFYFEKYSQGYIGFLINEQSTVSGNLTIRIRPDRGPHSTASTGQQTEFHKVDFMETKYRWAAQDVPAFKEEPFLTTPTDYTSKINFELSTIRFPYKPVENFMGSWQEINKTYYENADFGGEVKGNGYLKKIVDEVTGGIVSPEEKVVALVNYVKSNVSWDGRSRSFSASQLKKVMEEKKGNCAEINLLLASMIEKAGIEVYPVLSSTRDHGFIREHNPQSTQFNYVMCLAKIGDKEILLDATEPLLPPTVIPERCLNDKGMVVSSEAPRWISLVPNVKTKTMTVATFNIHPDGKLLGTLAIDRSGYEALKVRKLYHSKGEPAYISQLASQKDWVITKSTFENLKDLNSSFKEKHEMEINNHATSAGDVIYLNPFLMLQKPSNPFKLEKREYPVDFGFSNDEVYLANINIPEGYIVDELPKSEVFVTPGNGTKYLYNVVVTGNTIILNSTLSIKKSLFVQDEYPSLREFYNQVVAKQAQQIILKKKT
jgi:transglutaminase-like putative cysteine protease